jgi:hypothetical protein
MHVQEILVLTENANTLLFVTITMHVLMKNVKTVNANLFQRAVMMVMLVPLTLAIQQLDAKTLKSLAMMTTHVLKILAIHSLDVSSLLSIVMTKILAPLILVLADNVHILQRTVTIITNVLMMLVIFQLDNVFTLLFQLKLQMHVL